MQERLIVMNDRLQECELTIRTEMALKDEIEKRLMQHINVLKQEVKHAKKIIGDPKARDKLISDLNFSRVVTTKQE